MRLDWSRHIIYSMNSGIASRILLPGTRVRLDDGTIAYATYDPRDGTYRTSQLNPVTGGIRYDYGWRREQLEVVS